MTQMCWHTNDGKTEVLDNDIDKMAEIVRLEYEEGNLNEEFANYLADNHSSSIIEGMIDNRGYQVNYFLDLEKEFIDWAATNWLNTNEIRVLIGCTWFKRDEVD